MTFEISARSWSCFSWSVNFLDFLLAACSKVFRKASLSLMKEQVSRLVTVCRRPICYLISSHLAKRVKLISGLERKGIILRALMWAVTSLWPQKVVGKSQIYSARAKLKLTSDQARDLVKNCFDIWKEHVDFGAAIATLANPCCRRKMTTWFEDVKTWSHKMRDKKIQSFGVFLGWVNDYKCHSLFPRYFYQNYIKS